MKTIRDIHVASKKVFVRVDYNVPVDKNLNITDDNRIRATLDLIRYLIAQKAKIIIASHMGRPDGKKDPRFSLENAAKRLSRLLGMKVGFVDDCIGNRVKAKVDHLKEGQVLLLENLRFYNEEKDNDPAFSKSMAALCDIYVNDAFAVSHRDQASVTGIPEFAKESAMGFLLEKEVKLYYDAIENPKRPLVAIIGGAKVSSKLQALANMLNYVDRLIVGGAMANTFLNSQGVDTKGSMIEKDLIQTTLDIVHKAEEKEIQLLLPEDLICAEEFNKAANTKTVAVDNIPDEWMALDIGPKTAQKFADALQDAETIVWNGPMGVFEMEQFLSGTQRVANAVADSTAFSIVGGGDTGLAAKKCGITDKVSYISTGGGAFLHMMEGKILPGVAAIE